MASTSVDCTHNAWTLVAENVKQGRVRVTLTNPTKYFFDVKDTGEAAPNPNMVSGSRLPAHGMDFQFSDKIDYYIYAFDFDGRVDFDDDAPYTDVVVRNQTNTAFGETAVAQFAPQCGWSFNYNINDAIVQTITVGSATVTQDGSFAKLETGTTPGSLAVVRTRRALVYTPGIGALARLTYMFDTPVAGTTQLVGPGTGTDGWFFGYDGIKFGIMKRRNDIDEWIYQEDWSEDIRTDLDPTKGNVYQISYQWLGFGDQYFGIENDKGDFEPVHIITYSNLNTDVSVRNPSLPLSAIVFNGATSANITNRTPSAVGGLQGEKFSPAFEALIAYERIQTITAGAEVYLFGIQNPSEWLTKDNRLYVFPKQFAAASEGNKPIVFRVYGGVTITNPVWTDIAPNISPLQFDESGTFTPNGEAQVFTLPLGKAGNDIVSLDEIDAEVQPDQIFAVTAESSGASEVIVGINFKSRT